MVKTVSDAADAKVVDSARVEQRSKGKILPVKVIIDHLRSEVSEEKEEKRFAEVKKEEKENKVKRTPVAAVEQGKEMATKKSQPLASVKKQPKQQPSKFLTDKPVSKSQAEGKAQPPRGTIRVEQTIVDTPNIEAAVTKEVQPASGRALGTIPDTIEAQRDGANSNPEEPQAAPNVMDIPIVQDQNTSPNRNDPSLAVVVIQGEESPSLDALLAGVGSLSPIGNLVQIADEDLTDESYLTSSVLNSSELNFDRL